jgi:DNA invertase Pin-like site-specific DNA recombinase
MRLLGEFSWRNVLSLIGYARVSTLEQDLNLQIDDLKKHGCTEIFTDKASGTKNDRPGLEKCLDKLSEGDTLVVWRLDRLGRSMQHLVKMIESLRKKNVGFKSIHDGLIDTTTASGELVLNIFASLSQFEARLLKERTMAGLSAARARGKLGGRKPIDKNDPRVITAKKMHEDRSIDISDICASLKISKATLYRYLSM